MKCDTLEEDKEEKMKDDKMKNEGDKMQEIMSQVFIFEDKPITTFTYKGKPCWIAKDIGKILEYAQDGRRLVGNISNDWSNEFVAGDDYVVLEGKELKLFKEFIKTDTESVSVLKGSQAMLLFETGMHGVCLLSRKPVGVRLRKWLRKDILPKLARKENIILKSDSEPVKKGVWIPEMSSEALEVLLRERKGRELAEKDRDGAIVLATKQTERIVKIEEKMHEMQEEAAHGRAMMARKGGISIGEFADFVKVGGVRISQNRIDLVFISTSENLVSSRLARPPKAEHQQKLDALRFVTIIVYRKFYVNCDAVPKVITGFVRFLTGTFPMFSQTQFIFASGEILVESWWNPGGFLAGF